MRITTSFTLREKVLDELETISQQLNLSRSDIARLAIEFGLNSDNIKFDCTQKFFGYVEQKSFILEKRQLDRVYKRSKKIGLSVSALVNVYLYDYLSRIENIGYHVEKSILGFNDKQTKTIIYYDYLESNIQQFYLFLRKMIKNRNIKVETFYNRGSEDRYVTINVRYLREVVKEFLKQNLR